jgi:hypothetical protein
MHTLLHSLHPASQVFPILCPSLAISTRHQSSRGCNSFEERCAGTLELLPIIIIIIIFTLPAQAGLWAA